MSLIKDFYPITRAVSAIQGEIEPVAKAAVSELDRFVVSLQSGVNADSLAGDMAQQEGSGRPPVVYTLRQLHVKSLEDVFNLLLPLTLGTKMVLLRTSNPDWTAYFDNSSRCKGYQSLMACLSVYLKTRTVHAYAQPKTIRKLPQGKMIGSWGAVLAYVYNGQMQAERIVSLVNDAGPWHFDSMGEPYCFENTEKYNARKKTDRFTFEDLISFLQGFGLRPFNDDFYRVSLDQPIFLIERTDYVEEVRKKYSRPYDIKTLRARYEGIA